MLKKTKHLSIAILCGILLHLSPAADAAEVAELTPSGWWTGMPTGNLWIVVKGKELFSVKAVSQYPGVEVVQTLPTALKEYLLIELAISPSAQPGSVPLQFTDQNRFSQTIAFQLWPRTGLPHDNALKTTDALYRIAIDRFVNGNAQNDAPSGYLEKPDRNLPSGIHGGDIKGIGNQLEYLAQLGFSTINLSPVQENNNTALSAIEIAPTHFYKPDERLTSWTEYLQFNTQCRALNLKVIQQFTLHQASRSNGLFKDLPLPSWLMPDTKNYGVPQEIWTMADPYAGKPEKQQIAGQWLNAGTPMLNQQDEKLSAWLIQSVIWWVESAGLSAIELQTAWRNRPEFLQKLLTTLQHTHPALNVIADVPLASSAHLSGWSKQFAGFHNLMLTDYPTSEMVTQNFGHFTPAEQGAQALYQHLAADICYPDGTRLVTPADAPWCNRLWNSADKDPEILRMMLSYLLTLRGTPQLTYGTETHLEGISQNNTPAFYANFPGGWPGDDPNFFDTRFRSHSQNLTTQTIQRILKWRRENETCMALPPTHFKPGSGIYAHYRFLSGKALLVICNLQKNPARIDFKQFPQTLSAYKQARDVVTGETFTPSTSVLMAPKSCAVLELNP